MHSCWKWMLLLALAVALPAIVMAQRKPETGILEIPVGPARPQGQNEGPFSITIHLTLVINGREVTKAVKVTAKKDGDPSEGEIPLFKPPVKAANEKTEDFIKRWFAERSKFSKMKAEAIAKAINKEFGLAGANQATTGTQVRQDIDFPRPGPNMADLGRQTPNNEMGTVVIPNVSKRADGKPKFAWHGVLPGEGGDGSRFLPSGGDSTPIKINMGLVDPAGTVFVSTGKDSLGAPSIVEMGIEEIYVSMLEPTPGMDSIGILRWFEADLANHGIPTVFDDQRKMLFLANPLPDGQTFRWGNTDTGLEYITVELTPVAVPEPGTMVLWLSGFAAPAFAFLRRRR